MGNFIKSIIIFIVLFSLTVNPVFATNSYTTVLDGATEYFYRDTFSIDSDLTLMLWINMDELPSANGQHDMYINEDFGTGNSRDFSFFSLFQTNKLDLDWYTTGGTFCRDVADTGFTAEDVGVWKHIAVTLELSTETVIFYVDGSPVSSTRTIGEGCTSLRDVVTTLEIGVRKNDGYGYYDGKMDDVKIYNRALSEAEISEEYTCSLETPYDANLLAYYTFDSQNGADSSGNGYTLTEVNTPTYQSASLPFTSTCSSATPPVEIKRQSVFWF